MINNAERESGNSSSASRITRAAITARFPMTAYVPEEKCSGNKSANSDARAHIWNTSSQLCRLSRTVCAQHVFTVSTSVTSFSPRYNAQFHDPTIDFRSFVSISVAPMGAGYHRVPGSSIHLQTKSPMSSKLVDFSIERG